MLRNMYKLVISVLLLGLIISAGQAQAEVYKRVNPDGSVEYSDQPMEGATAIRVPKPSTYRAPPLNRPKTASSTKSETTSFEYQSLRITTPENDKVIRSNAGNITAIARLIPELQSGHRARWRLDGEIIKGVNALELRLKNVDRGSHTLQVEIVDADGNILVSSEPVTFHLLRHSILQGSAPSPPRPPQPPRPPPGATP